MAAIAVESDIAQPPHAKTHKCVEIASMQLESTAEVDALLLPAVLAPVTRKTGHCGLGELTGARFLATIIPELLGSEARVGVTNSKLRDANFGVAADWANRKGTIGPL